MGRGRQSLRAVSAGGFDRVLGSRRGSGREDLPEETYREVDADGTVTHYRCPGGPLHRDDGPAVEDADGTKEWYRDGQLHRDGGPAVEDANGTKLWYRDDKLHRDGGPAVEDANGTKRWYRDAERHRDDGPAVEHADGSVEYWLAGVRQPDPAA